MEAHLKVEVEKLLELAETAEDQDTRGLNIPVELARREERLKKIAQAKAEIERRARERYGSVLVKPHFIIHPRSLSSRTVG